MNLLVQARILVAGLLSKLFRHAWHVTKTLVFVVFTVLLFMHNVYELKNVFDFKIVLRRYSARGMQKNYK